MILEKIPEIQKLTATEKGILLEELWDDLAGCPETMPLSPQELEEIERRMADYQKDPTKVLTWEQVKAKALRNSSNQ